MRKIAGGAELLQKLKPYRTALLVLAAGVILLLLPSGGAQQDSAPTVDETYREDEWLRDMQKDLEDTLSRVEGAGRLTLMLSVESGMQKELAQDGESVLREDENRHLRETVILSSSVGGEEVVVTRAGYPVFRGAVVVCQGGDRASVRLAITDAVTALTGLSSDKISVIKGNGT